jgi:hypothetical protein
MDPVMDGLQLHGSEAGRPQSRKKVGLISKNYLNEYKKCLLSLSGFHKMRGLG